MKVHKLFYSHCKTYVLAQTEIPSQHPIKDHYGTASESLSEWPILALFVMLTWYIGGNTELPFGVNVHLQPDSRKLAVIYRYLDMVDWTKQVAKQGLRSYNDIICTPTPNFLLFPLWSTMSTFFHAAPPWLLFPRCCAMTTFSTLLHYVYFFHAAVLWLLFKRCCALSTFSMMLTMTTFSTMLRTDYFFNTAALCLPYSRCWAMTTFSWCSTMATLSTLLR